MSAGNKCRCNNATHRAAASTAVNARTEPSHEGSPLCTPRPISEHHKFHTIQTFGNQTPKQIKRPRLVCNGLVRSAERVTFSILLSTRNEKKVLRPFCYTQNIIPPCATSTHLFLVVRLCRRPRVWCEKGSENRIFICVVVFCCCAFALGTFFLLPQTSQWSGICTKSNRKKCVRVGACVCIGRRVARCEFVVYYGAIETIAVCGATKCQGKSSDLDSDLSVRAKRLCVCVREFLPRTFASVTGLTVAYSRK